MITLLLGGIKSGRTALAESMALAAAGRGGHKPLYIACGRASDAEMAQKIARHQATRAGRWLLYEDPDLTQSLTSDALKQAGSVVIDSLSDWLTWKMEAQQSLEPPLTRRALLAELESTVEPMVRAMRDTSLPFFLVGLESGQGMVALSPAGRLFQEANGQMNQHISRLSDSVYLVVAGRTLRLA